MEKGDLIFIVLIILLLFLSSSLIFVNLILSDDSKEEKATFFGNISGSPVLNSIQFYPNMRFANPELKYWFEPSCNLKKIEEVTESLSLLSEETVLEFMPSNENSSDILIFCSEMPDEEVAISQGEKYFIAGEGGPTELINLTRSYLILKGKISLFRDDKCKTPHLALHELLHALGFDHNNNPESIMYPVTDCDQTLDSSIIDTINEIYKDPPLQDLAMEKISISEGAYRLYYSVSVANYGYLDSQNVSLTVFADNEKIGEYNLGEIKVGVRKIIDVKNLKIFQSVKNLKFIVLSEKGKEITLENNFAEITIHS